MRNIFSASSVRRILKLYSYFGNDLTDKILLYVEEKFQYYTILQEFVQRTIENVFGDENKHLFDLMLCYSLNKLK